MRKCRIWRHLLAVRGRHMLPIPGRALLTCHPGEKALYESGRLACGVFTQGLRARTGSLGADSAEYPLLSTSLSQDSSLTYPGPGAPPPVPAWGIPSVLSLSCPKAPLPVSAWGTPPVLSLSCPRAPPPALSLSCPREPTCTCLGHPTCSCPVPGNPYLSLPCSGGPARCPGLHPHRMFSGHGVIHSGKAQVDHDRDAAGAQRACPETV